MDLLDSGWRLSKWITKSTLRFQEISSKALKAEAIVKKAIDRFESELVNIFSEIYDNGGLAQGCWPCLV